MCKRDSGAAGHCCLISNCPSCLASCVLTAAGLSQNSNFQRSSRSCLEKGLLGLAPRILSQWKNQCQLNQKCKENAYCPCIRPSLVTDIDDIRKCENTWVCPSSCEMCISRTHVQNAAVQAPKSLYFLRMCAKCNRLGAEINAFRTHMCANLSHLIICSYACRST